MKKNSISKRLGVATEGPLTKAKCLEKVRKLKKGLEAEMYKGKLRDYAVYYKNWYAWRAENGPRRSSKKSA